MFSEHEFILVLSSHTVSVRNSFSILSVRVEAEFKELLRLSVPLLELFKCSEVKVRITLRGIVYMRRGRMMNTATQAMGTLTASGSCIITYVTICKIRHHMPAK